MTEEIEKKGEIKAIKEITLLIKVHIKKTECNKTIMINIDKKRKVFITTIG